MSKEMWIAAWDDLYNDALDAGKSEKEAEAIADAGAQDKFADRLADMIDMARQRKKDERA